VILTLQGGGWGELLGGELGRGWGELLGEELGWVVQRDGRRRDARSDIARNMRVWKAHSVHSACSHGMVDKVGVLRVR